MVTTIIKGARGKQDTELIVSRLTSGKGFSNISISTLVMCLLMLLGITDSSELTIISKRPDSSIYEYHGLSRAELV